MRQQLKGTKPRNPKGREVQVDGSASWFEKMLGGRLSPLFLHERVQQIHHTVLFAGMRPRKKSRPLASL